MINQRSRLSSLFRQQVPHGKTFFEVTNLLQEKKLNTVCQEAKCPNRTECFARGTLTFQILGNICTRRCGFCAEKTGKPGQVDLSEPQRIADAIEKLKLRYVVLTAPARDDLPDGGASVFATTVGYIKSRFSEVKVEVLVSDLEGNMMALQSLLQSLPDVFNHNIETVRRLTPKVRAKATYENSLNVLQFAALSLATKVKSGIMLGLGETMPEIEETLRDLRNVRVHYLTVGQYLQPSPAHLPVEKYYTIAEFNQIKELALSLGFEQVFSGPLIRSSYHADEMHVL